MTIIKRVIPAHFVQEYREWRVAKDPLVTLSAKDDCEDNEDAED